MRRRCEGGEERRAGRDGLIEEPRVLKSRRSLD